MSFHRYTAPTYFGGLPSGYDYLNNLIAGTPAAVQGPRSDGGPNNGTYFLGYGENAVSGAFNRGLAALGTNTDALDDLLHRDLAVIKNTTLTTAASPVSTITLTGPGIFLGLPGTASSIAALADLFSVVDDSENDVMDPATGTRSRVVSMVGGAVGGSFSSASVTVTINPAIPAGVQYKLYYGQRSNLATMPIDTFTKVTLRGAEELNAGFLDFRAQVARRDSSGSILALLASTLETPDGTRLPRSSTQTFDVDPAGGLGGPYGATWRRGRDASLGATVMAELVDQPVGDVFGLTRWFAVGRSGVNGVGSNGGTLALFDTNTANAAGAGFKYVPFSENTNGAQTARIGDVAQSTSILRSLNGRAYVSVGDGVNTFGDYNGATAITDAIAAFGAVGTLHIRVKAGNFSIAGATGPTIPGGMFVILEGEGTDSSIVTSNVTDGKTFSITGGTLTIRSLRLSAPTGTATIHGIFTGANGYIRIYNAAVERHKVDFVNSNGQALAAAGTSPASYWKSTLIAEDSSLDMTGANASVGGRPLIHIHVSDGLEHHNFFLRNCVLKSLDNNSPLKVEAPNTTTLESRVRNVGFDNCRVFLGGATTTGQFLDANAGVLSLEPNNTVYLLGVDNVYWRNCNVWANYNLTGTVSTLIHVMSGSIRYNNTTEVGRTNVGRITIDGGDWVIPDVNTALTSWNLAARTVAVRNLNLRQTSLLTGQVARDAYCYLTGAPASSTPTPSGWGAYMFHTGVRDSNTGPFEPRKTIEITNVRIRNVQRAQCFDTNGVADIGITGASGAKIQIADVRIAHIVNSVPTNGKVPYYRVNLYLDGAAGSFEDVVWDGSGATNDGNLWVNVNGGYLNLFGGTTMSSQSLFRRCGVYGPGPILNSGAGIYLQFTGQCTLDNCFAQNCGTGLSNNSANVVGTLSLLGGNFNYNIVGLNFTFAYGAEFVLNMNGLTAFNNSSTGLILTLPNTAFDGSGGNGSFIQITNCTFMANGTTTGTSQVTFSMFGGTPSTNLLNGVFIGNVCVDPVSSANGVVEFQGITTVAIQNNYQFRGILPVTGSLGVSTIMNNNFARVKFAS